jgi:serine/threonine protein kinase
MAEPHNLPGGPLSRAGGAATTGDEAVKVPRKSDFERCGLLSGLLNRSQLGKARASLMRSESELLSPPDAPWEQRLADKLVEMGWLNVWQAKQLLEGRTKFNLGPYWIVDYIGRGGMGQVFKAEHGMLGRTVAVKVLPRNRCTPEAIANFTREIRAQARLDHKNLVRAYDAGEDGNVYFLVTEYVPGNDLRKLVRTSGPLSMIDAAGIVSQIACGLHHAHQQGLVHRDVKPGNILVTAEGLAKLSDLGLAGPLAGGEAEDPRFGRIVGTADYLSPDHIQSPRDPKPAWDIYSLGCTLYYAVTGKVPFPGGTTGDKAQAHLTLRPLDPRRLNPRLSDGFVEVIAQMMAKDPAQRVATAEEVVTRLAPWTGAQVSMPAPGQALKKAEPIVSLPPGAQFPVLGPGVVAGQDLGSLPDTISGFPELPEPSPAAKDSSSQISQATCPIASASEETAPILDPISQPATPPGAFVGPVLLLIAFPLTIAGTALALWWLSRLLP